ncbi:hypothetical protein HYU06_01900 [Candidatus Woesearchaeota archaeon]|nr:hypothetical protein [Candidatus Woesearchaeota archaeon]
MQEIYEARVQEFNKKANHIPKTEADAYSLLFGIISFAFLALLIFYHDLQKFGMPVTYEAIVQQQLSLFRTYGLDLSTLVNNANLSPQ